MPSLVLASNNLNMVNSRDTTNEPKSRGTTNNPKPRGTANKPLGLTLSQNKAIILCFDNLDVGLHLFKGLLNPHLPHETYLGQSQVQQSHQDCYNHELLPLLDLSRCQESP